MHACTHTTILCTLTPLYRSHFRARPEIKFLWQSGATEEGGERERENREGKKQKRDRKSQIEPIDRLELAQSGIELYHKRRASQQEALWYASKGKNRGMFTLYSSFASLIHFISLSTPGHAFLKNSFIFFPFFHFSWLLHLLLSPFVFHVSVFLSASFSHLFSSGWLISILSVHIIDSSCLPLVKMSFIILCDS